MRYDNLHGDEDECRGFCGSCDDCLEAEEHRDNFYESRGVES